MIIPRIPIVDSTERSFGLQKYTVYCQAFLDRIINTITTTITSTEPKVIIIVSLSNNCVVIVPVVVVVSVVGDVVGERLVEVVLVGLVVIVVSSGRTKTQTVSVMELFSASRTSKV
jgi:hypothetical protein